MPRKSPNLSILIHWIELIERKPQRKRIAAQVRMLKMKKKPAKNHKAALTATA